MSHHASRFHLPRVVLFIIAIGGLCMLLFGIGLHALITHDRTESAMQRLLSSKGVMLLGSLEGSLRSSRRGNTALRQDFLLEEMSHIEDVLFAAIVAPDGFILAHSNPERMGEVLVLDGRDLQPDDMRAFAPSPEPRWRLARMEGDEAFVLYKQIGQVLVPASPPSPSSPPLPPLPEVAPGTPPSKPPAGASAPQMYSIPLTLFVGLDPAPLTLAKAEDRQRNMLLLVGGVLCGLFALFALHWALRARLSRQGQKTAEALTEKMVLSLPDGLMLFDAAGRISHINATACAWLGQKKPPLGRAAADVLPPQLAALTERLLLDPVLPDSELEIVYQGEPLPLGARGGPVETAEDGRIGSLLLLRDLSERKKLEAEIRRREKLAAVCTLAAGVAHEIRNPLSSIKGYATYFGERFPEASDDREAARVMVGEVERVNRVISELIELARPASIHREPVDLKALAEDMLRLIRPDAAARHIALRLEGDPALEHTPGAYTLDADPDKLRQVLLNLCLNGLDAMPEGGVLTIAFKPGKQMLVIEVRDTGQGIAAEVLPEIFDPYFTTKGHGTGLGLPNAHKIIEAHGGRILAVSGPGQGAVFRLELPRPEGDATAPHRA